MDKADPRYQVPSRKHLTSKLLPAKITKTQADLMARLKKADKVCATIDLWSSRQMRSYFGVTGHFIVDWALESVMLGCIRFRGSHTADAIAEQFSTTAATYDLNDKISHIVTDNAANMLKAFSLPGFETTVTNETLSDDDDDEDDDVTTAVSDDSLFEYVNDHISCFAHTLQLVIKDGFQQAGTINKVLAKASAVVSHVRKYIHATEMLENYKCLQTANATRWNSQLAMVRSILNIPDEKLRSLDTQHQLTAYDRNILKDLIEVLTPFESATHCVQGDWVVTGSMVVPCVRILKTELEALYNKFSSKFVLTLKNSVHKRLTKYEDYKAFQTASVLDPRFKLNWCSHSESQLQRAAIITKATQIIPDPTVTEEQPPPKKRSGFFSA